MEAGGAWGRRPPVGRVEASPERGRPTAYALSARPAPARPMRKVQIIYYLCRNGQLEHPHFMELAQHPHQPLRLKDVMDRLTLLRGKGMPALFSWSCKRNYKNGYVWNDLSENDVIYPSDGVEYVLKGSEIFPGCSSGNRFQHLRVTDRSPTKPPLALPHMSHKQYADSYRDDAVEDREDDELGYSYHHRRTASSGRLVAARADKPAVSARTTNRSRPVELPVEETSPPSSTSSDKPPATAPQQQQQPGRRASDMLQEPEPSRPGSMLLQLIACGSTAPAAAGGGGSGKCRAEPRRSCGLVSRLSARGGADEDEDEEEEAAAGGDLGRRFGHLAVQDKEYFSGSIVEGAGGRGTPLPASSLKRSNSYNEERSCRPGAGAIGEETMDEHMEGDGGIRGRCIPGRKKTPPPQK